MNNQNPVTVETVSVRITEAVRARLAEAESIGIEREQFFNNSLEHGSRYLGDLVKVHDKCELGIAGCHVIEWSGTTGDCDIIVDFTSEASNLIKAAAYLTQGGCENEWIDECIISGLKRDVPAAWARLEREDNEEEAAAMAKLMSAGKA